MARCARRDGGIGCARRGGGSAAWNADGSGLFYTRYPAKGERPDPDLRFYQQTYFHKLGTSAEQDTYEFGKDLPRIAETVLREGIDVDGGYNA